MKLLSRNKKQYNSLMNGETSLLKYTLFNEGAFVLNSSSSPVLMVKLEILMEFILFL